MLAIITARGGSKGIPNKNLTLLAGKPLLQYTIDAALHSGVFSHIVVSSDSDAILQAATDMGATALRRPPELAEDNTPTAPVISHALETLENSGHRFQTCMLLQPTSPLRNAHHIQEAVALLQSSEADMIVSVTPASEHPMKAYKIDDHGELVGAYGPNYPYTPRQTLPTCYYANGAIYLFRTETFKTLGDFPKTHVQPYIMNVKDSTDIDTPEDLQKAEQLLLENNQSLKNDGH